MNTCKLCGKPLTLTPEYDTCMECQGRIMREATMPQNSFTTNSTKSNRNVYDEAIKEVKKLWNGNELTYPKHTIKALERAKKEHELLGLYRIAKTQVLEYIDTPNKTRQVLNIALDIHENLEEIEEKEKELEKLK